MPSQSPFRTTLSKSKRPVAYVLSTPARSPLRIHRGAFKLNDFNDYQLIILPWALKSGERSETGHCQLHSSPAPACSLKISSRGHSRAKYPPSGGGLMSVGDLFVECPIQARNGWSGTSAKMLQSLAQLS